MPIYEFVCLDCKKVFEYFVMSQRDMKDVNCPHCGSSRVHKVLSSFHSGSGGRASLGAGSGCGGSTGFR